MHKLKPITPMGADTPCEDRIGSLVISEVVDQAMASVACRSGQEDTLCEAFAKAQDLCLPEVGKSTSAGDFSAFWIGPEQWMILAPHDQHEGIANEVKQLVGASASVVEQTDAWCRFDVKGLTLADLMERLTNAPVRSMATGDVIRSTVEHLGTFLWRLDADRMAVIAPRSSASSLYHALVAAARSIA